MSAVHSRRLRVAGAGAANAERLLEASGWERRFSLAPERVGELRTLYESLGYEVRLERPAVAPTAIGCGDCADELARSHYLIFTRRRSET